MVQATRTFEEHLSGLSGFSIVIESRDQSPLTDAATLGAVDRLQQKLQDLPGVDRSLSIVDSMKLLNQAFHQNQPAFFRLPDRQDVLEEMVDLIESDPRELSRDFLSEDHTALRILVRSSLFESTGLKALTDQVAQLSAPLLPPTVQLQTTGTLVLMNLTSDQLAREQVKSLLLSVTFIFTILIFLCRSFKVGLMCMIPAGPARPDVFRPAGVERPFAERQHQRHCRHRHRDRRRQLHPVPGPVPTLPKGRPATPGRRPRESYQGRRPHDGGRGRGGAGISGLRVVAFCTRFPVRLAFGLRIGVQFSNEPAAPAHSSPGCARECPGSGGCDPNLPKEIPMKPQRLLILCISLAVASPALGDERGDELIAAYLEQAARKNKRVTVQVKHVKGSQPPIVLAFTWMRRVQAKLTSHFIRMESPESEQGKLLLVHERADGSSDFVAYRPQSALRKKVRISGARHYKYKSLRISVQELIGGELAKYTHHFLGNREISGVLCHPGGEPAQARVHRQERFSPFHPGIERGQHDHGPVGAVRPDQPVGEKDRGDRNQGRRGNTHGHPGPHQQSPTRLPPAMDGAVHRVRSPV